MYHDCLGYLGWESGLFLIHAATFVQQRDSDAVGKVFWSFERGYPHNRLARNLV